MEREDETGPTELVSNEPENNDSKDQVRCYIIKTFQLTNFSPHLHLRIFLQEEEYNKEKLRQYQLNRLKYYYGVVESDSPGS